MDGSVHRSDAREATAKWLPSLAAGRGPESYPWFGGDFNTRVSAGVEACMGPLDLPTGKQLLVVVALVFALGIALGGTCTMVFP